MRSLPGIFILGVSLTVALACGSSASGDETGDGGANGGGDTDGGNNGGGGDPTTDIPFGECAGEEGMPPSDNALCLIDDNNGGNADAPPLAIIEHAFVDFNGVPAVHIRVTMDPAFVDNNYGGNACGWTVPGHSFFDLEESDHCEIVVLDSQGTVIFDLSLDYIGEDPNSACGYSAPGPYGDEGEIRVGDPGAILHWDTSLSQNFNQRGYCYPESSPEPSDPEDCCSPSTEAPNWDYRVVYEVWLARSAFEPNGFGSAYMSEVHASPSKRGPGQNIVQVSPEPCDNPCNDPDGCDHGDCITSEDCEGNQFCYNGDCLYIIE